MDRNKETENEVRKLAASSNSPPKATPTKAEISAAAAETNSSSSDTSEKKNKMKKQKMMTPGSKKKDTEEFPDIQNLEDDVEVAVGDKIRVFYHSYETIYEAKVKRIQDPKDKEPWPK